MGKTLVVFLPWLGATEEAVARYQNIYQANGDYDFFVHYARMKDFLWPRSGLAASRKVLDEIKRLIERKDSCGIIIHASSIGCFFYSLMIWQIRRNKDDYAKIWQLITLHIMDSPVLGTTTEMAVGVSKMMSRSTVMSSVYRNIILFYFAMTKAYTVSYYNDLIAEIRNHSPNVPSLLLTSSDDPMCMPQAFENVCEAWRSSRCVVKKVWVNSKHARHFFFHPNEYRLLVKEMLEKISGHKKGISQLQSKL